MGIEHVHADFKVPTVTVILYLLALDTFHLSTGLLLYICHDLNAEQVFTLNISEKNLTA
jgi:hypothetical protein